MPNLVSDDLRDSIQTHLDLTSMGSTAERTAVRAVTSVITSTGKVPAVFADEVWQAFMEAKNQHFAENEAMWGKIAEGICEYLNQMWAAYIGNSGGGADWKESCRVVVQTNLATLSGRLILDGVVTDVGDRVLLSAQTDATQNGIWVVAQSAWSRSPDMELQSSGWTVYVSEGDENSKTYWVCITTDPIVTGETELEIIRWNTINGDIPYDWKASARAASSTNEVLSGIRTVGGVSVVSGNRVLLFGQTDAKQNGIWMVQSGSWLRALDSDRSYEMTCGVTVYIEEGTYQKKYYTLTTFNPITLGTTELTFENLMGSGGAIASAFEQEYFTYAGVRTLTLAHSPLSKAETVFVNGVMIRAGVDYTVSGADIVIDDDYYMENGFIVGAHYSYAV